MLNPTAMDIAGTLGSHEGTAAEAARDEDFWEVQTGSIALQESVTYLHATVFMLGAAYTMQRDEHVRVDIFYRNMSRKRKACVDLVGVLIFVMPLCCFFGIEALDYVAASWSSNEVSRNAGGLPYPLLPLLKSMLLVMPALVALQGLSLSIRSIQELRSR